MAEIHICRGINREFVAQVREAGCRKWVTISRHLECQPAIMAMAHKFAEEAHWKRGRVLFVADYYEPHISAELHR
jgi:hypothetical protein